MRASSVEAQSFRLDGLISARSARGWNNRCGSWIRVGRFRINVSITRRRWGEDTFVSIELFALILALAGRWRRLFPLVGSRRVLTLRCPFFNRIGRARRAGKRGAKGQTAEKHECHCSALRVRRRKSEGRSHGYLSVILLENELATRSHRSVRNFEEPNEGLYCCFKLSW